MKLISSAFSHGGEIPRECGYKNGNQEPPLRIGVVGGKELGSTGIHSLALIMDDPDAMEAVGKVWVHWVAWNFTWFADGKPNWNSRHGAKQGMTDFGEVGYGGPAPPDKRHTYVFKLYALDDGGYGAHKNSGNVPGTKADLEKAMEGHIIEQTQLTGTYAP